LKIEFLKTLDAILRLGTFARAGEEVGLTASAVSLQVKRLEEYLGQPLFDRSARTARPTPFAVELAQTMRSALQAMDDARSQQTPSVSGKIVVGAIRTTQSTSVPVALRHISARFPQLTVRVIQGDSVELLQQLQAGLLDAAVLIRPSAGGSSRLSWRNLERQQYVFVAPPDSKGHSIEKLLEEYPWIQFDTSLSGGSVATKYVAQIAPRTRTRFELESIEAIHALVSAGAGVSVLPKLNNPMNTFRPVRQISLGNQAPSRQIAFVCRKSDEENRRVSALREAFSEAFSSPE
jgi:DNA-binding transcriptional LysR family regulator